jgi:hypothetical protein
MRRGMVPTAAARQAEADRQRREWEFRDNPGMVAYDRVSGGGALARSLARPTELEEAHMAVIDELKAAMRQFTQEHEALAATLRRWTTAPRPPGTFDPDKPHDVALDGSDLGAHPAAYVERQRKAARSALQGAEARAAVELSGLLAEATKGPTAQYELGTKLSADARGEVPLLVEQYRNLTKQEQADMVAQGQKALGRGDLQAALTVKRAADVLHIAAPEFDMALVEADPQRKAAKVELDYLTKLRDTYSADVTRRHVSSGMAGEGETVKVIDDPINLGMSATAGPYVTQAIGQ